MKEELIRLFKENDSFTLEALRDILDCRSMEEYKNLIRTLDELEEERMIWNNHDRYIWIDTPQYFIGRVRDASRYEFIVSQGRDRVFVNKARGDGAFDRDEVLVRLSDDGNRIVHIFRHGIINIIGEFRKTRDGFRFYSDVDLHAGFRVVNANEFVLHNHEKAVVTVVKYGKPLEVKIIRLLGDRNEKGTDISAILVEENVRQEFPPKAQEQTLTIPTTVTEEEIKGRRDFRELKTITIDGDSSKDFDDAISVEKTDNGWRLYVHIADVSHYVKNGTPIDQEAYLRGTSVYVADRVVPMLPFELSNGICSLNPDVDRLTMTAIIDIDRNGDITNYEITDSVIHSDHRCTYNKVNQLLDGDAAAEEEYKDVADMIRDFRDLSEVLMAATEKRGSINFELNEPTLVLDENGKCVDVFVRERGFAERMIEEAMIRANIVTANALNSKNYPGIYRVHGKPDAEKLEAVINMAHAMNVPVPFTAAEATTDEIQDFLNGIEDQAAREILSTMAVRAMSKAVYDGECTGHFGLGLKEYSHFTSPIRRYPDLIMHRMLKKYLIEQGNEKDIDKDKARIKTEAAHTSEKERDAVSVERRVTDYKMAEFMSDKIGNEYTGRISGITGFGFFVELPNMVEGLVPARTLMDDFYKFDPDTLTLKGETNDRTFHMGDEVRVRVNEVDVPKGQVNFELKELLSLPEPECAVPAGEDAKEKQAA